MGTTLRETKLDLVADAWCRGAIDLSDRKLLYNDSVRKAEAAIPD